MVALGGNLSREAMPAQRRGILAVGVLITVALCAVAAFGGSSTSPTVLEGAGSDASTHVTHHRLATQQRVRAAAQGSLARLQSMVARDEQKEGRDRTKVVSTEDAYVAARARASSFKAEGKDEAEALRKLGLEKDNDDKEVTGALLARKRAAQRLAERQNTAKMALKTEDTVFGLDDRALRDKDASEKDEAEGIAIQKPAAALLKDSQKLNDQSNLVLDQSKSSQAKALAALDLNLAQSLATRASEGMKSARTYFSQAISERKKAVDADEEASADTTQAAKASLKVNDEMPALLHVLHGENNGRDAVRKVVNADQTAVNKAEAALGEDRQAVRAGYSDRSAVFRQIDLAQQQSGLLRKELVAAQRSVVQAARAHVAASKAYKDAEAARRGAEDNVEGLEGKVRGDLQQQLKAAEDAREQSSAQLKRARESVDRLGGKQTLLQMQVARLKLQLKEAQIQSASGKAQSAREREQVSELQTQLDREDGDLNAARLRLADEKMNSRSDDQEAPRGRRGRGRGAARAGGLHAEAARAVGEAEEGGGSLPAERERERRMQQEQANAELSAREEERKLKRAQMEVQKQMDKVRHLEMKA